MKCQPGMKNEEMYTGGLGLCCCCETKYKVRTIVMLPKKASIPGTGWGCIECDLPHNGALYVCCDNCHEESRPPKFACKGYLKEKDRVPIEELTEDFAHDYSKHQDDVVQQN